MQRVEIRVRGQIDEQWSEWLGGLTLAHTAEGNTDLSGVVADQTALYGLLGKLRDMGLALVSVQTRPASIPHFETKSSTESQSSAAPKLGPP